MSPETDSGPNGVRLERWGAEDLPSLGTTVADMVLPFSGDDRSALDVIHVERAEIDLPVELDIIIDDDGTLSLGCSPPTQFLETSVLPVFHRLRIVVVAEERG